MGRPHEFFRVGIQYYVAGRHALLSGHETVAGNLFHQGFEMILKADLLKPLYEQHSPGWTTGTSQQKAVAVQQYTNAADQLLAKDLRHDLPKVWSRFKLVHPSAQLDPFDGLIRDLHKWWTLRYPGFPAGLGTQMTTSKVKTGRPVATSSTPVDAYDLCLEDMDELLMVIAPLTYTVHAIQLAVGGRRLGASPGLDAYERENLHKLW